MIQLLKRLCRIFHRELSLEEIANKAPAYRFFRGLSKEKNFTPEGYVRASAFEFNDHTKERPDNNWEASINWDDDSNSLTTLLEQRSEKTNQLMFDSYSYILLSQLKSNLAISLDQGHLDYERKPLPHNKYHGNLLSPATVDRKTKELIKSNLAMIATQNLKKESDRSR